MRIPGKPVEFGNHKRGAVGATERKGTGQFRPLTVRAALDLDYLGDQFPGATIEVVSNVCALCFQSEPRPALSIGADA
ncbi:hypothetical protein WYO_2503 [Methylobacterium sp. GXF4]|nr:hypothetical protein WYO_2503 [Methylobacterium sp. GXF4]